MKYVLPPVLLLLTPVMIFYLPASENGSIFFIQLATMIFTAAVSVKKKQQLRLYQRWFIPLLIGGQILTLVLLAFVLWPETAFGEAGKLNAAKDFMRAMTSGNSNAAILMIPKEDASEETYDLIIRELTNPENSPTYWELEEPDIFNRIEGRIIVPDGVYLDVVLRVRWEWTKARWVISGVDFGGEAATSIIKFDLYDRSTPFEYVKIGVNTLALVCLLFSTVYIMLNASFFIKPLWRRIGL